MLSKIKNAIIFLGIGAVLVGGYLLFGRSKAPEPDLVSSSGINAITNEGELSSEDSEIARELLGVLLNVKSIRLEDSIFNDEAFMSLRDSSILLVPDGNEGRPNPFAPIGSDLSAVPINATPPALTATPIPPTNSATPAN